MVLASTKSWGDSCRCATETVFGGLVHGSAGAGLLPAAGDRRSDERAGVGADVADEKRRAAHGGDGVFFQANQSLEAHDELLFMVVFLSENG